MRLRTLYLLAGLVLGGLAGLAVALQAFALAAGVSWLYLFGDDPWPASAERYLLAISLAAGLATWGAGLAVGYAAGRRCEASPQQAQARRRGYGLLLAGLALWLLVGLAGQWQAQRQSAARATAAAAEAAYADLLRDRHVISAVRVTDTRAEAVRLSVAVAGRRGGIYRLSWSLDETLYDVTLESGERRFDLGPEPASLELAFEPAGLARRYRATVLEGRPDKVLVDGPFRLRLSLVPELSEAERQALPEREVGNLERGLSDLRFETSVDLPMTLDLTGP